MEGVNCCMMKGKYESLPAWTKPIKINGTPVVAPNPMCIQGVSCNLTTCQWKIA